MIQMLGAVMQLFKGSYFSVAAGSGILLPYSAIANGTTYMNYVLPASKWSIKNHIFQRSTNETLIIGLDIDFNLEVWGVIVFLEVWTRADFLKLYQVN